MKLRLSRFQKITSLNSSPGIFIFDIADPSNSKYDPVERQTGVQS